MECMKTDAFATIRELKVVPIVVLESADDALPLADALLEGGLPAIEITFRTKAAQEAIRRISSSRPEMLVGAGTILSIDSLKAAEDAGATFALAPGLNPKVVAVAQEDGFSFLPGVATPSEIELALSMGLDLLKLFPSGALGGVKYLNAIYGPFAHTGVKFVATGGVTTDDLPAWLASKAIAGVGGTWIAKGEDIAAKRWDLISGRCRAVRAIVDASK